MNLPHSEQVNNKYLSRLFDNTSECYKFFWFQAILTKISEGKSSFCYEELINEMICDAWYMVNEYHLNLGPNDNLENAVKYLSSRVDLKSSEKKSVLLESLSNVDDKELIRLKKILIQNVPYRLQAPFMPSFKGKDWSFGVYKRINHINEFDGLLYYFDSYDGLNTRINMSNEWLEYLSNNIEIIKGWLKYNMIIYLQKRNPSVPGIADKLYPPMERKLTKVIKYWKLITDIKPLHEIYGNNLIDHNDISIDHFVPWSYVAHDELWNLHPTTKSINSSKNNSLPDWDRYFPLLCKQEYLSYELIWKYDSVHSEFNKCAREHLNSLDIYHKLYRDKLSKEEFVFGLEETMWPVYSSAKNIGFRGWIYGK